MTLGNGSSSSSPTYETSPSAPSPVFQNCLLSDDEDCLREQANQAQTTAELEQLRKEEAKRDEAMMAQAEEQHRSSMVAAGLDPEAGQGFWCFRGRKGGRSIGECRRSQDECIERLLFRERSGMEVEDRRCIEHAQAACFRLTRTLKEGERVMCFDELSTCQQMQGSIDAEGFASAPTECEGAS